GVFTPSARRDCSRDSPSSSGSMRSRMMASYLPVPAFHSPSWQSRQRTTEKPDKLSTCSRYEHMTASSSMTRIFRLMAGQKIQRGNLRLTLYISALGGTLACQYAHRAPARAPRPQIKHI